MYYNKSSYENNNLIMFYPTLYQEHFQYYVLS